MAGLVQILTAVVETTHVITSHRTKCTQKETQTTKCMLTWGVVMKIGALSLTLSVPGYERTIVLQDITGEMG